MEINKEYTESFNIAKQLISDRMLYENRMGINDDKVNTNLISKHYSPMIVRKYNIVKGWPLYIGLICDEDLSDLDHIVNGVIDKTCIRCLRCVFECPTKALDVKYTYPLRKYLETEKINELIIY